MSKKCHFFSINPITNLLYFAVVLLKLIWIENTGIAPCIGQHNFELIEYKDAVLNCYVFIYICKNFVKFGYNIYVRKFYLKI